MTPLVSLLILTYNRLGMVRLCLKAALGKTDLPFECLVWDNGSTDGTSEWLDTVQDPRLRVVHASGNLGFNGYALLAMLARGEYLLEIDDDVIDLPEAYASRMLQAFLRVPKLGYLSLHVVQDDRTDGAKMPSRHYRALDAGGGTVLEVGPVGGWCTMTPRAVYEAAGGFPFIPGQKFMMEDAEYGRKVAALGRLGAILSGVRCYHATGPAFNAAYPEYTKEKYSDYARYIERLKGGPP